MRRAVVVVLGDEAIGEFVHVQRADQDRVRGLQAGDERRIACRGGRIAANERAGQGLQALDVEQVLDRERHARQGPRLRARRDPGVQPARIVERPLVKHLREGVQPAVDLGDAVQGFGDHGLGLGLATGHRSRDVKDAGGLQGREGASGTSGSAARASETRLAWT